MALAQQFASWVISVYRWAEHTASEFLSVTQKKETQGATAAVVGGRDAVGARAVASIPAAVNRAGGVAGFFVGVGGEGSAAEASGGITL
ncbi:hypothetical protein [Nocardia sp. NPDC057455]|uniref:hypothetical protein n=1 Tax=Nocardia sp. NPDC057455 TaxID=3346138 RepID=UPI003670D0D8